jgi:hypothetical protein
LVEHQDGRMEILNWPAEMRQRELSEMADELGDVSQLMQKEAA